MDQQDESSKDSELSELLESALNDFFTPTVSAPSSSSSRGFGQLAASQDSSLQDASYSKVNMSKMTRKDDGDDCDDDGNGDGNDDVYKGKMDDILNEFIEKEPQLREQWQKLSESCKIAAESNSDEAFEALGETLKSLSESAKSISEDGDISEEELSRLWSKLGTTDDGGQPSFPDNASEEGFLPDLMPLVTNLMQNLLSKQVLYPSIKDLSVKYPDWLDEHKDELDEKDLERYSKQLELMKQVCDEFESESEDDPQQVRDQRFQKILKIMQDMKDCGSPPKDLVGDVPEMGADMDFSKIPGLGGGDPQSGQGCSVM